MWLIVVCCSQVVCCHHCCHSSSRRSRTAERRLNYPSRRIVVKLQMATWNQTISHNKCSHEKSYSKMRFHTLGNGRNLSKTQFHFSSAADADRRSNQQIVVYQPTTNWNQIITNHAQSNKPLYSKISKKDPEIEGVCQRCRKKWPKCELKSCTMPTKSRLLLTFCTGFTK